MKFTAPFYTKYRLLHNFSNVKVFSSYDTDKLQGSDIVNSENSIYELKNNNSYYVEIYNDRANPMSGYIEIDVFAEEIISENKVIVKPLINTFCKIEGESRIVTLNIVGENVNIEFYDDEFNLIDVNKYEAEYNFIKNDGVGYILFKTDSPQDVTAVVSVVNDSPVTVDEEFSINGLQSKYYLFVPYVTADYLFKTNINNVDVGIVNFENGRTNRLIGGEKYFLFVKNENLKTAMFSVEFDALNVDIGRNNLYEKSIGVYKFIPPQNMKYTVSSQIPIDCVCINGVKTAINALEFSNYYERNTEIYIIINNVKATTTIEIKAFYDEELTVGKGTDIETTGNDGLVVKFSAQKNSYYVITETNDFCLYSQNLSFIEYNDSVYLSTGIYYLDFAVQTGEQVSVKVEAVSQIINPHEHYTFNYTSYLFVILKQNTEYIFETLGDIDKNISTAIEIYDKSGINLLTSAKFTKFGKIDFSTGNNTEFNIIVRANTKSNFVFRIVYAMGSVGENKVSLSVGGYTTVASGSYLEIAAQKQVELYFSIPNDLASIELYNVNGYEKLTPSVTYSSYKKYVFLDKGNVKLYVNADNAKYLSVVLLPEIVNNELIVKDATNEIVNEFLFGNSYSFEWNNNGNIISNSISSLIFTVNGTVSQPFDVMFNAEDIETNIEISFILFDRSIIKTFTVVGSAYELDLDFALATDVQKNSTVDEKSTLHLTIKADLIDNGSDGTTEIIKKTVNLIQNGEVVCNWDFVEDKLIDLSEYAWSDLLKFSYEITFSDGGIYRSESLLQNDSFLLNENIDISSDMKVLNLKGGAITDINKVITIPSNILMVNIKGYTSREYDKITFFVAERNQPVLFNIENFYCYSYYEKMIGYACFYSNNNNENDAYIVMKMKGNNTFYASQEYLNKSAFSFNNYSLYIIGESDATLHVSGADGIETKIGQYGFGGSCAIFVDDLYIQGFERVSLYGGCGSDGGFGKNGEDATDYTTTGGSGEDGKNGGNGLSAIVCDNLTIINTKNFSAFGGDGGRGGKGGDGGNGAVGRSNPNKDGGAGGNGSNGGYGGTGGCGGNGADAVVVRFSASINVSGSKSFLGGNAGAAGKGGKGGKGGDGGTGATGTSGIAGGAGGKGGNGGNGGDGGNGGVVGKAGYGLCVSGERSETKGLTYDSPDYLYAASGVGGAGGNGGKGGSGGSGWFGTTGSAGASGKAGTIGDSGEPGKK